MLWPVAQSSAEPHGKPNPQLFDLAILLNWIYSVYGLGLLDLIGRASPLTAARYVASGTWIVLTCRGDMGKSQAGSGQGSDRRQRERTRGRTPKRRPGERADAATERSDWARKLSLALIPVVVGALIPIK